MHWGDDVLLLYLAPFFKPHSPKCGNLTLGVKANRSVAAAKRMNWKWSSVRSDCAFGDMKGVLETDLSRAECIKQLLSLCWLISLQRSKLNSWWIRVTVSRGGDCTLMKLNVVGVIYCLYPLGSHIWQYPHTCYWTPPPPPPLTNTHTHTDRAFTLVLGTVPAGTCSRNMFSVHTISCSLNGF